MRGGPGRVRTLASAVLTPPTSLHLLIHHAIALTCLFYTYRNGLLFTTFCKELKLQLKFYKEKKNKK